MGRMEKVNQQVHREVSRILLQELSDPRLEFVTITSVDVSRDLRSARVRFSVLGDEKQAQDAQNGLNKARGAIRRCLGQRLTMRFTPDLTFFYDAGLQISENVNKTLKEIDDESQ